MRDVVNRLHFGRDVVIDVGKNLAMGMPFVPHLRVSHQRTSTALTNTDEYLERYAFQTLRRVLKYREGISGLRVAEIGPGDHLATGLSMLAAGARTYTCLDRFPGSYSNDLAKRTYRAVRENWPAKFPGLPWPKWLDESRFPEKYPERVKTIALGVERITADQPCDLVCSYAVAEHVQDIAAFAKVTYDLLAQDGMAVHVVDFTQHSMWPYLDDPYMFLRLPDWLWRLIGSNRGLMNRYRYDEFEAVFTNIGLNVEISGRVVDEDLANPESLCLKFRSMPIDSVKTREATFILRKLRIA
jgi:hypothetical protein